jgi:hypothetical protein
MKKILPIIIICFCSTLMAQKELIITATPQGAELYRKLNNGGEIKLGSNPATIKLEKDVAYIIEARLSGYVSVTKTYIRNDKEFKTEKAKNPKETIALTERIVTINASPADCRIFVNGSDRGRPPMDVTIPKGQSVTVEAKKSGFVTQTKTFYNKEGQDDPSASYLFKLEDRVVSLKVLPTDATIFVDDKKRGEGNTDVIIGKEKCAEIRVERTGYTSETATYCNKENEPAPPLSDQIRLKNRLVQINPTPDDASIFIDGKEVGKGSYTLKLSEDQCVQVIVRKETFLQESRTLCNKADMQVPELTLAPKLSTDQAYSESTASEKANRNFNVEVSPDIKDLDAWKILNSIVQTYFDEIETVDASTGYMRTNWVLATFNKDNKTKVRTRIIVTTASILPLKYNLKIQSESTENAADKITNNDKECVNPPVNRDDCFYPWPRILRKYSEFISEVQRRLQAK